MKSFSSGIRGGNTFALQNGDARRAAVRSGSQSVRLSANILLVVFVAEVLQQRFLTFFLARLPEVIVPCFKFP